MTGWQGGSCEDWSVVYANGTVRALDLQVDPNRFGDPFGQRCLTPEWPVGAVAVVRHGVTNGKPATPYVYFPE
jgi:hypothetical protein